MPVPWKNTTAFAAAGSLVLNWAKETGSRWSLLRFFVVLWLVGIMSWAIWAVWVYPLLVSPLRHLPQPRGSHWLYGQFKRIVAEPSGIPMREWFVQVKRWLDDSQLTQRIG